jgi:hypothetical protein
MGDCRRSSGFDILQLLQFLAGQGLQMIQGQRENKMNKLTRRLKLTDLHDLDSVGA